MHEDDNNLMERMVKMHLMKDVKNEKRLKLWIIMLIYTYSCIPQVLSPLNQYLIMKNTSVKFQYSMKIISSGKERQKDGRIWRSID